MKYKLINIKINKLKKKIHNKYKLNQKKVHNKHKLNSNVKRKFNQRK
jgi:hypothetical protein